MTVGRLVVVLVLALFVLPLGPARAADTPPARMTNADVIKLVGLDLGDDLVIAAINRAAQVDFRLDTEGLTALRAGNVSREVIRAMFARTEPPAPPPAPAPAPAPAPSAAAPNLPPIATTPADRAARCAASYSMTGSMFVGRVGRVALDTAEPEPARVLDRIATYLEHHGKKITGRRAETGEIWVEQKADTEEMPSSKLAFTVRKAGTGTNVEARYHLDRATIAHYDVKDMLCEILVGALAN